MSQLSINLRFSEDGENLMLSRMDAAIFLSWVLGGDHDAQADLESALFTEEEKETPKREEPPTEKQEVKDPEFPRVGVKEAAAAAPPRPKTMATGPRPQIQRPIVPVGSKTDGKFKPVEINRPIVASPPRKEISEEEINHQKELLRDKQDDLEQDPGVSVHPPAPKKIFGNIRVEKLAPVGTKEDPLSQTLKEKPEATIPAEILEEDSYWKELPEEN